MHEYPTKTMAQHNTIGIWGENIAKEYLITEGYSILETNKLIGRKEIDIIATKGNRIAFVEVKTRSTPFTDPIEAVDKKKIKKLTLAADSFLRTFNIRHEPQFDIITIIGTPESGHTLTHYPDAFIPPLSGAW